jgi:hypothetical protein
MRILRTACLAVVLVATGLLVPATAASAASGPLTANVTCDAQTGEVTTSVSGQLFYGAPAQAVKVEFKRTGGVRVTSTGKSAVTPMSQPFAVTATTTSSGSIDAAGYTGLFNPASQYYRETMTVTFKNPATGAVYTTRTGACNVDRRTTVTLTCDPETRTYTATASGINGQFGAGDGAGRPYTVSYLYTSLSQATATDPAFEYHNISGWDYTHRVARAGDGSWTDVGYVHTSTSTAAPWYSDNGLTVAVFDQYGAQVGAGTAKCVMFRQGQPVGY